MSTLSNSPWIRTKLCGCPSPVYGITVDNKGNIFFTSYSEHIYHVREDSTDAQPRIIVTIPASRLFGIVWSPNNSLYFCDNINNKVYSYSLDTQSTQVIAQNKIVTSMSSLSFRFGSPTPDTQLVGIHGIALDNNGELYITQNHCIRKVSLDGTYTTIAGTTHTKGYKDGPLHEALFNFPSGIVFSKDGTIFIADTANNCIRQIKDGIVSTIGGHPYLDGKKEGALSEILFLFPNGLVLDDGSLYVGDSIGLRIINLQQKKVKTDTNVSYIYSLAKSNVPNALYMGATNTVTRMTNTWRWEKFLWIGNLKENATCCLLATLPKEIVKLIACYIRD